MHDSMLFALMLWIVSI